uniref:Helicase domino n=1 Tax=Glossina brevipalpis TaxID=37001 RepID=A0A1A9WJY6_9MUSC
MNEGESAGGGHQGSNPAPPAVPDRISTTVITSSNRIITTNNLKSASLSTPLSLAITADEQNSASLEEECTSPVPRSFQQAFAQHSLQPLPTTTTSTQQQEQLQQQSLTHMPQTSSNRFTSSVTPATTIAPTIRTETPIITAATITSDPSIINTPLIKRKKLDDNNSTTGGEITVLAPNICIVGSLLPTSHSHNCSTNKSNIATTDSNKLKNNPQALKKLILEQKYLRLRSLKEKHSENVAELFYLQTGGNMMDYPTWRKKPPTPQFITYSNAYRLDQLVNDERTSAANTSNTTNIHTQQQHQTADSIATIIGVVGHTQQPQQQQTTQQTNTQSQGSFSTSSSTINNNNSLMVTNHGRTNINNNSNSGCGNNNVSAGTVNIAATHYGAASIQSTILPTTTDASGNILPPQGAEIKIPAVGATPVAVSTKLPAAVQQLNQQGGTPLIPCSTAQGTTTLRRNGNSVVTSNTPPPLYSPTPSGLLVPASSVNTSSAASVSTTAAANSAQEFSYKAKQEVDVMRRIMELQREGLWTEKRLPKQLEPGRPKAHWDYLLEEMVWLAADFAQERKWKKAAAKKCAKMVQKYFQDKANAAQKAEKAQEAHLKRVAAFIAKEVKMFWSNVEKLVEYKHHTKIEEKRKKALDQHLSFIVDQTEKFSQQLAEGMNKTLVDASANPSINSSRISSPKRDNTDEEFRPESASDDDEETIAKAEEEEAMDVDAEVAALEKESQMELDDVIKDLPKGYLENRNKILLDEEKSDRLKDDDGRSTDSDDGEFVANETSEDDENTISKQEAEEIDIDHQKELDELEADNDLTVVELLARYTSAKSDKTDVEGKAKIEGNKEIEAYAEGSGGSEEDEETVVKSCRDSDDDSTAEEESDDSEDDGDLDDEDGEENTAEDDEGGLKSLFEDTSANSKDDMIKDAAALAESLQPKGNTLSSTNVVTPVPFLLKHTLREYQHIGLDWLVTMNERKLNGILADEMGLGKTIQTIALLAHLACVKGNWGPHLIVVPSSVMLNWEMEFKKWCPGFKILTYYGVQKERKMKRVGWTKPNAFHVCITSYKLVVQDQQSFRRKKWKYLILDEAQNIKNFKSQRWQLLLNFSTERRLLLTGTPLQNDLMELWSLMHFLMPYVFSSHREFKEWFSNPMTGMIEGNLEYNDQLIQRLHKVIRPFLLRRLKKEVEKQMPKKYEHVIMCRLSNRQRYLYDDFMSRAKTKETLQTGNLLSVINVLMQLRKVCNHPNMFEVRPTISPFQMEGITYETSRLVCDLLDYNPFTQINLHTLNLLLIELELTLTAYVSHKSRLLAAPRKFIEEIDTVPEPPPQCPTGKYKFHIRVRGPKVQQSLRTHSSQMVRVGASPTMKTDGNKLVPVCGPATMESSQSRINKRINHLINPLGPPKFGVLAPGSTTTTVTRSQACNSNSNNINNAGDMGPTPPKVFKLGDPIKIPTVSNGSDAKLYIRATKSVKDETGLVSKAVSSLVRQVKSNTSTRLSMYHNAEVKTEPSEIDDNCSELDPVYNMTEILQQRKEKRLARLKLMATINKRRTEAAPIYGADCRESLEQCVNTNHKVIYSTWSTRSYSNCCTAMARSSENWTLNKIIKSYEKRCENLKQIFNNFVIYVPSVCAPRLRFYVRSLTSTTRQKQLGVEKAVQLEMSTKLSMLHPIISAMTTQFPDPRLIQYDCGKLQTLDRLLKELKADHHRVLIFTQMTKMLDVLEAFLNYHGHIYLRLDGATKVEQRQILMERFNSDKRIFCFILSTRSGGVGVNLTGADTVIFYDSDWNPTMDAQAQDRCHRIGQTRDVHIYRLVSEKTIEVNILKKANQKRMLSDMAIEGGNFTTSYFKSSTIKDLFNVDSQQQTVDTTTIAMATNVSSSSTQYQQESLNSDMGVSTEVDLEKQSLKAFESALAAAEDEQDVQAAKTAKAEAAADLAEFDENIPLDETMAAEGACSVELSKADLEMQNLVKQLSPIERYAMRFVEETGAAWTAEQLRAAEEEIEAQKREWEANRLAALQKEEEMLKQEAETAEELLTYSRKDATNQVNKPSNYKTNSRQRAKLDRKSSRRAGGRNRDIQSQQILSKRRGRQPACRLITRQQTQKQKQSVGSSRRMAGRRSKNSQQLSSANEEEEDEEGNEERQEEVTTNDEESNASVSEEESEEEQEEATERGVIVDNNDEEEYRESETEQSASDEELDDNTIKSRGSRRARRTIDSGSFNNKRTIVAKSRRAVGIESKNAKYSTKTIRKTTRTSMAAAAITTESTEIDVKQNAKKNASSKRKHASTNTLERVENTVNKPNKNSTGVKNQKLLSFATKRLKQKRKEREKLYEKHEVNETKVTLKRKASITPAGDKVKRRAVGTRKSPRKLKQPETEIEDEDSKESSDEERPDMVKDNRSLDCNSDISEQIDEENKIRSEEDGKANSTDEEERYARQGREMERQKHTKTKPPMKTKISIVRGRGGKTIQNSMSKKDSTAEESDGNGEDISAQASDDENDKSSCLNIGDQEGGNSSSIDMWNAHTQMLDTTTNSTYYNVSEESESDENQTMVNMNPTSRRTPAPNGKPNATNLRSNFHGTDGGTDTDNHTPRTRSRGSVKINLWTLDESPILSSLRSGTIKQIRKESTGSNYVEEHSDNANKDPLTCASTPLRHSLVKRTSKNENTGTGTQTLQRWVIRTPRPDTGVVGEYDEISTVNGPKSSS